MAISSFSKNGPNWFLSNFSPSPIVVNGLWFPTVEHAYQSFKAKDDTAREWIRTAPTPREAQRRGRATDKKDTFDHDKLVIMNFLLKLKFENPVLGTKLLATEEKYLIEGNYWHDNFWGDCYCDHCRTIHGENWLGKLLMQRRTKVLALYFLQKAELIAKHPRKG